MDTTTQLAIIFGMALVTAIPRVLPLLFLSSRTLSEPLMRFLEMIPPAVLAALLAQEILLQKTDTGFSLYLTSNNLYLIALIPTVLVGWFCKNFFVTVTTGMITVALLRLAGI